MNKPNPIHLLIIGFCSLIVSGVIYFTNDYTILKTRKCIVTDKPKTASETLNFSLTLGYADKDFRFPVEAELFNHSFVGDTLYLPLRGMDMAPNDIDEIIYEFVEPALFIVAIVLMTLGIAGYDETPNKMPQPAKSLQQQLSDALEIEDYMLAAKLRNKIKKGTRKI